MSKSWKHLIHRENDLKMERMTCKSWERLGKTIIACRLLGALYYDTMTVYLGKG